MKILSIETSCDDTGITIFEATGGATNARFKILSDNLASQTIHAQYGGVFPVLAKREHAKNLPLLLAYALKKTKLDKKEKPVDAIAVTYGPGLEMCLWEGITFAQKLAKEWKVPIIPTNHMEGHVLSVYGKDKGSFKIPKIQFPVVSLLVSGGHTDLVVSKSFLKYEIIGRTRDDAAGEAFDKVARMMELPYPGGPHISKLAEAARVKTKAVDLKFSFPRPMMHTKDFDFSFSGLKTSVLYFLQKNKNADKGLVAMEFENAVVDTLVYKTAKAVEKYKAKTLIIAGGVAVNKHLRNEIKKVFNKKLEVMFPTPYLCRDNSLMIGIAGYLNFIKNKKKVPKPGTIKATGNLRL